MEGIVIKTTGSQVLVRTSDGTRVDCRLKGQFKIHGKKATNPVAVGDRVSFLQNTVSDPGLINEIHPRHNYIIRKATRMSKVYHVIAANLDQAFLIVTAAFPRTPQGFIDRFLTTSEAYHIPAGLVFNKTDLYGETKAAAYYHYLLGVYTGVGYPCIPVSALTGDSIPLLKEHLDGKVTLFSGPSGVGKSALINAIFPGISLKTGELSAYHQKGKHTTTFAEMIELPGDTFIIDTPGIREFGLTDFRKEEVAERFPEFRELQHRCRFHNCLHLQEPACAVKEALQEGKIHPSRYRSYLAIVNDEDLEENDWE
ncbi:MAG TPA: ribosome small subunit-dependent GTPase A [Bacteroidales bacterium]|nr:ribosome small subunit-dependent GTPase A [Bacteroidales bacterium]HSA43393.1 ribosome small subunit-dependent GTPase A [Bacteroidales bacterium]